MVHFMYTYNVRKNVCSAFRSLSRNRTNKVEPERKNSVGLTLDRHLVEVQNSTSSRDEEERLSNL